MTPLEWLGLIGFVVISFFPYPIKYTQYSEWMDDLVKRKAISGATALLLWMYDYTRFIVLAFSAVGYFFFWKDPGYQTVQPNNYQIALALHLVSLLLLYASAFQFTYWFNSRRWRIASLIILAIGVLGTEVVALVYISIEAFSNASTAVLVPGQMYLSATIGLSFAGSLIYAAFILMTAAIYVICVGHDLSKHINSVVKRRNIMIQIREQESEVSYQEYAKTTVRRR